MVEEQTIVLKVQLDFRIFSVLTGKLIRTTKIRSSEIFLEYSKIVTENYE